MSTRIVVQHGWHGYKYWKVCVWQYILVEIVLPLHTNSCIKKRARQTTADGSREVPCCTDPLCVQIFSLLDIFQTSVTHRWALRSCLWTVHTVISVPMTLLCLESGGFFLLFKKKNFGEEENQVYNPFMIFFDYRSHTTDLKEKADTKQSHFRPMGEVYQV